MDHLIVRRMITCLAFLIPLIIFPTHVSGRFTVTAVCGEVVVGKPFELTCNIISGNVSDGISWFVSGNNNAIISCKDDGKCSNRGSPLYSTKDVQDNKQQFTILKVSNEDLHNNWTCVDGGTATSEGFSSCQLKESPVVTTPASSSNDDKGEKIKIKAKYGAIVAAIVIAVVLGIVSVILYFLYKDHMRSSRIYIIYCVLEIVIISILSGVATYFLLLNTKLNYGGAVGMDISIFICVSVIKFSLVKGGVFSKCESENTDKDSSPACVPLKSK